MNIGIVGQGAIGTLFAYYWRNSLPIILLKNLPAKNTSLTLINKHTVVIQSQFDSVSAPQKKHYDYLFITLKSYQIKALIECLRPWLRTRTNLILVQNGMGGAELLAKAFPNNRLFVGTTTDAVFKSAGSHFQVTANGRLDIGPWVLDTNATRQGALAIDAATLQLIKAHPKPVFHNNISIALYQKLAVNALINPITALLNIKNGQLMQHSELVAKIKTEISSLYLAYFAHDLTYNDGPLSAQHINQLIDKVIKDTADNYSSMQQDVFYGRQTEVDAVLGYLLQKANQLSLKMPNIESLNNQIIRINEIPLPQR